MKKLLVLLVALAMIFTLTACSTGNNLEDAATAYFADYPGSRIVTWEDLSAKIDAGDEPFILSIRQADVYEEGHIAGAYLASWGEDLANSVSKLPTDETVYVYCYSGQTAGQTVALLNMLGIDAVSVKSGYNNGISKAEGYEAYVDTVAVELEDAGAKFDKDVLEFVENYFASVDDNGNYIRSAADAIALADSGDAVIVDIRTADDYAAEHIEGAISIPFGENMQESFSDIPDDKTAIVVCYSGQTAGQTVGVLNALGYDALSLKSGMNGYTSYVETMSANAYFSDYPGSRIITWADLFAKIDDGEEPFILSIRAADDYAEGHISGAYLAAWGADLAEKVTMLPTDQPVYVYCYSGQTAGQAVAVMNMMGIEAISVKSGYVKGAMLEDGYEAYVDTEAVELADAGATYTPFMASFAVDYFNAITEGGSNIISLADAEIAVNDGEATVVDIRTAEDFAAGHIAGAVNVPFGEGMQDSFGDLPEGKLIVACYSGQTAGQTTAVLRALGLDAVSLKYGMKVGWVAEGYPVVTD